MKTTVTSEGAWPNEGQMDCMVNEVQEYYLAFRMIDFPPTFVSCILENTKLSLKCSFSK